MREAIFRINPAHDPERLAAEFRATRRLHIPQFLEPEGAERLLDFTKSEKSWKLIFNSGDKLVELDRATQAKLTKERKEQFDRAIYASAREGFQYRYETIRTPDAEAERKARGLIIDAFAQFMSHEPALSFFRVVLGQPDLTFADAQATAYGPGHFLTAHDDNVESKNRKAAFVMNLTKNWSADWGGLLVFHNHGQARAEALIPTFNSLNLFAVPQVHSVTLVTPSAPRRRLAVTGWLRTGRKP